MITATHLHAMIVHFPIALLLVGFLFEIIGLIRKSSFFKQASFYLLLLTTAGAIVSYLTGDAAGDGMEDGSLGMAIEAHEHAATVTLWLTIVAALTQVILEFVKKNILWLKVVAFILFAAAVVGVSRTGYLGGQLVFKHAAGVELSIGDFNVYDSGVSNDDTYDKEQD